MPKNPNLNEILDPSKSRDILTEILSGKEYEIYYVQKKSFLAELWERITTWLSEFLHQLFPQTNIAAGASEWIALGMIIVFLLLLSLLVFFILSRSLRRKKLRKRAANSGKELALSFTWHLSKAQKYAEQEEHNLALRHLFLGFILLLDQNSLLEARAWKTNGEYYTELKAQDQQLADTFYGFALKFEESMYGGRTISPAEYLHYQSFLKGWTRKGENNAGQILIRQS